MGFDRLVTMRLSGSALRAVCEHSLIGLARDIYPVAPVEDGLLPIILLQFSGLRVVADLTRPAGERVLQLSVSGQPMDPARLYSVVTVDFLARGYSGYHWFYEGDAQEVGERELNVLMERLCPGVALPAVDGRLQFQSG
jgi:hypothetical protein